MTKKFVINASQPASDKIFDVSAFEKFLNEKIKVDGRVGNLGDTIQISQQGDGKIEIIAHNELSGRYLKYLYEFVLSRRCKASFRHARLTINDVQDQEVPQEDAAP